MIKIRKVTTETRINEWILYADGAYHNPLVILSDDDARTIASMITNVQTLQGDVLVNVTILGYQNKINAIKATRAVTDWQLKESKEFVEMTPRVIARNVSQSEADRIRRTFIAANEFDTVLISKAE